VEADVVGRGTQQGGIVLELAQAAIAIETEQGSDAAGRMIVIDVDRRRSLAYRTETTLLLEHRVCFFRCYPVPTPQVVSALAAQQLLRLLASDVVARLAVRGPPVP
jgi:hypothetical protein